MEQGSQEADLEQQVLITFPQPSPEEAVELNALFAELSGTKEVSRNSLPFSFLLFFTRGHHVSVVCKVTLHVPGCALPRAWLSLFHVPDCHFSTCLTVWLLSSSQSIRALRTWVMEHSDCIEWICHRMAARFRALEVFNCEYTCQLANGFRPKIRRHGEGSDVCVRV